MKYGYLKTKDFWEAAAFRALWTLAESILALEGASKVIQEVDWRYTIGAALLAAFLSICKSIVFGVPEAERGES